MNEKCPVPQYQRPLTEYNNLKNSFSFVWTIKDSSSFFKTLFVSLIILLCVSTLIMMSSYGWEKQWLASSLQVLLMSLLLLTFWITRLYFAWRYIYTRLMNATVTYEESGWYDGQTWVKPNQILIQDQLVGTYEVLPIVNRLWLVLILCCCTILVTIFIDIQIT
jgi:hypothetical protein